MVTETLLLNALLGLATAAVYAKVGLAVAERNVSEDARLAAQMFTVWWTGLAGITVAGALLSLAGAAGLTDLALHVTVTYILLLVLCIALAGLIYYLAYLYTGNRNLIYPIAVFYILYFALLIYYITARTPVGVIIGKWTTTLAFASEITGAPLDAIVVLLLVPPILGALAYFSLYFRVDEPAQRRRILLVGGSLAIWFGLSYGANVLGISTSQDELTRDAWQITSRLIGLSAAVVIYIAYRPQAPSQTGPGDGASGGEEASRDDPFEGDLRPQAMGRGGAVWTARGRAMTFIAERLDQPTPRNGRTRPEGAD